MSIKEEERYHRIRIIVSILTLIGGCFAFVISNYLTSNNLIRQQKEQQQREFKQLVLKDRVTIYKDVCKAVGEIIGAADKDTSEFKNCFNNFEKLYWGEFSLVEDSSVIVAGDDGCNGCNGKKYFFHVR